MLDYNVLYVDKKEQKCYQDILLISIIKPFNYIF